MSLTNFQLEDTMSEMDILQDYSTTSYQRQQAQNTNYNSFQQDMHLLFTSNSSSPHLDSSFLEYQKSFTDQPPCYRSQPECYSQEDILTPLISPATTPSFDYPIQTNKNINFSSELNFSPLSSPAMMPQIDRNKNHMSTNQIREQYEQLEKAKLLINQQLSEIKKTRTDSSSMAIPNHMKPATPASLMSLGRTRNTSKRPKIIRKKRDSLDKASSSRALKPLLISPKLRPGPNTKNDEEAERILATRSNYQNLMEGKGPALGIAFNSQIKSGLEVRRTAHKAAEQKRRDSLKEWFDKLRCEVEEGYVKRQKSLMSQVIQAQELEGSEGPSDTMKPLSKVLLLQYAYEYIDSLKTKLSEKDAIIQSLSHNS